MGKKTIVTLILCSYLFVAIVILIVVGHKENMKKFDLKTAELDVAKTQARLLSSDVENFKNSEQKQKWKW